MQVLAALLPVPGNADKSLDIGKLSSTFKALGDPNRLRLLFELIETGTSRNVGQAARVSGIHPTDIAFLLVGLARREQDSRSASASKPHKNGLSA